MTQSIPEMRPSVLQWSAIIGLVILGSAAPHNAWSQTADSGMLCVIEYFSIDYPYKLGLRARWRLVMEPTQHPLGGAGMIVLQEHVADPRFLEGGGPVGLREKPPVISVPIRRDAEDLRDRERLEMKGHKNVGWRR